MKIYLSKINESWVIDRLKDEWLEYNDEISTKKIKDSDIIWIIAPWLWKKIPKRHLKTKKVVCSIHHFEDKDFLKENLIDFYDRDKFVTHYHVISPKDIDPDLMDKDIYLNSLVGFAPNSEYEFIHRR